jgi:hypothetical protein
MDLSGSDCSGMSVCFKDGTKLAGFTEVEKILAKRQIIYLEFCLVYSNRKIFKSKHVDAD